MLSGDFVDTVLAIVKAVSDQEFREFVASTFPPAVGHYRHLKVDQEVSPVLPAVRVPATADQ